MDNQENQEDNIKQLDQPKEKRPRGRPKLLPEERKPKKPTDPEYSKRYYEEHKNKEPKPKGRPKINLTKVYYKPKDPDYFKKYYLEKTKPKIDERELIALKYFLDKFQNEYKNEEKKQE
jgi:hypothetical protein